MSTAPYTFWVYGSSTNHQTVSTSALKSSHVPDTVAGGTLPAAATVNGWTSFKAWGLSPELIREDDEYATAFGAKFNGPGAARWQLTIETDLYDFPDDFAAYTALLTELSARYVYFAVGTYASGVTLHYTNYAIAMHSVHSVEHDYPNGKKSLTITLKYRYAHNSLIPA